MAFWNTRQELDSLYHARRPPATVSRAVLPIGLLSTTFRDHNFPPRRQRAAFPTVGAPCGPLLPLQPRPLRATLPERRAARHSPSLPSGRCPRSHRPRAATFHLTIRRVESTTILSHDKAALKPP